jgi:hypothetical protein
MGSLVANHSFKDVIRLAFGFSIENFFGLKLFRNRNEHL